MTPTSPVAIVNAVMADLLANSGLTPITTRSYAEPTMLSPSQTPYLAVWCEGTEYKLLSAGIPAYNRLHELNVAWYVADTAAAESGGTGDPAVVEALINDTEELATRIAIYSGGIPGLSLPLVAALTSRSLAVSGGALWRGLLKISVEEAA